MLCYKCEAHECVNFGLWCQVCLDALVREEEKHEARLKNFYYNKMQYADQCATCHREEVMLWIVSFRHREDDLGFGGGPVTGVWCDECIAGMVGRPEITSGLTFKGISGIQFLKKCYDPAMGQVAQEVCGILKDVDF